MATQANDAVEALLEQAQPRAAPPADIEHEVRAAVREEWLSNKDRRRRRRIARNFAVAAGVLLAVIVTFTALRQTGVAPVQVAEIDQSLGTLQLQGGAPTPPQEGGRTTVVSGQILTTGNDAAAGLTWLGGGSLRINQNTRVEFLSPDEIYLHFGMVYFDSFGADPKASFIIRSPHGDVSHIGTQYLTESNAASLVVTVREGEVAIDGVYHEQTAHRGQRVELTGSSRPSVTNTTGAGGKWEWVETVSPTISVDGMSAYEFLNWVGRETGHTVTFDSTSAERLARATELKGSVNAGPREELRLRMMTMDIDAEFDPKVAAIIVSD